MGEDEADSGIARSIAPAIVCCTLIVTVGPYLSSYYLYITIITLMLVVVFIEVMTRHFNFVFAKMVSNSVRVTLRSNRCTKRRQSSREKTERRMRKRSEIGSPLPKRKFSLGSRKFRKVSEIVQPTITEESES